MGVSGQLLVPAALPAPKEPLLPTGEAPEPVWRQQRENKPFSPTLPGTETRSQRS
jgi:hypothetical protein